MDAKRYLPDARSARFQSRNTCGYVAARYTFRNKLGSTKLDEKLLGCLTSLAVVVARSRVLTEQTGKWIERTRILTGWRFKLSWRQRNQSRGEESSVCRENFIPQLSDAIKSSNRHDPLIDRVLTASRNHAHVNRTQKKKLFNVNKFRY